MKVDGAKIRKLREERGYTLSQFAKKADISVSYMSEIEQGLTNPSLKTIQKIAEALNIDKSQLLEAQDINLGTKLRLIRNKKGLTLTELAQKLEISSSYLSEIERGNVKPSIKTLKKISEVLDIPLGKILNEPTGLGKKLKKLREEQGITQAELAKGAGVSAGLIGQIEQGRVQPSLQTIEKIAKELGVSPCYFIINDDDFCLEQFIEQMSPDLKMLLCDEKVQSVLRLISNCNEKELKFIFDFIKLYKKEGAAAN
ncbi:MAG: Transcriptional regulator, XRE family [Clostridia bacterium 41_269]|nr:MAG: Transcriptional regulator, XRE family [Clostridia bacterium 41_269]